MYSKYYRIVNSKINPSLGSIAIAAKKLSGHPVEGCTVAHAKNIMNIMLVHEHNLVPATLNQWCKVLPQEMNNWKRILSMLVSIQLQLILDISCFVLLIQNQRGAD